MPRFITTLKELGRDMSWTILQQARGIPEAKGMDDFLEDKTFVLLFGRHDLSERLCITAAIRQMSGHTVYMGPEDSWEEAISQFPSALLGSISYYMDGVIIHGLDVSNMKPGTEVDFPVLNCGGKDAHPAHALADVACMMRFSGDDLRKVRLAWIGAPTGTLISLMQATVFFPFALQIALPESFPVAVMEGLAKEYKTDISFHATPQEAVKGCQFVMAGSSGKGKLSFEQIKTWALTQDIMAHAEDGAHILLGTNPMMSIPVDDNVLNSRNSLLLMQAEYRLRVYKRLLHWLYEF